jgi:hypothetical protein
MSSFLVKIGLPKAMLMFAFLSLFSAGKTFSVPLIATGTIGISWRAAKKDAPFLASLSFIPMAVPSGKNTDYFFSLICLLTSFMVEGLMFFCLSTKPRRPWCPRFIPPNGGLVFGH